MAELQKDSDLPLSQQNREETRADFDWKSFDNLVYQKGLTMTHEHATVCPCREEHNGNAHPSCVNCKGLGWLFGSPSEIRGIIQAVSFDPKRFEYSKINMGLAMLTVMERVRLSWFDRLTLLDGESTFSENLHFDTTKTAGAKVAYSTYAPITISAAYLYVNESTPYVSLVEGVDYTVSGRKITLTKAGLTGEKFQIALRYEHKPVFVIMDINKDIRNTAELQANKSEKRRSLPQHATIKRLHFVLDRDA